MSLRAALSNGELNDSQFNILAALLVPRHGYAVMQLLMDVPDQIIHVGPASLNTTLHQLVDAGLLERCASKGVSKCMSSLQRDVGGWRTKSHASRQWWSLRNGLWRGDLIMNDPNLRYEPSHGVALTMQVTASV